MIRFFSRVPLDCLSTQAFTKGAFTDSQAMRSSRFKGTPSTSRIERESLNSKVSSRGIKIGGLLALVLIGGAFVLMVSRWPFTRESIVSALQKKFSSTVELKTFQVTYFTPGFVAEGVTFRRNGDPDTPPIATIEKLTIQGAYWEFFSAPSHVRNVRIEGLRIFASPGSERIGNAAPPAGSSKQSAVIIDQIVADGAVLEFASSESGTEPLKFAIHELTLNAVADDRPLSFHAALLNPRA